MGYPSVDAASYAHHAELAEEALRGAQVAAEGTAGEFSRGWDASPLRPEVTVALVTGSEGQPLFIFSLNVDLDDDLAAAEFPADAMAELAADLRRRIVGSSVDGWAWLVTAHSKAGTRR